MRDALIREEHRITVPADIANRARLAIERMVAIGGRAKLVGFSPMQFEGFMRTVGQPALERVLPPRDGSPPDIAKLQAVAERNGFIVMGPPGPPPNQPR